MYQGDKKDFFMYYEIYSYNHWIKSNYTFAKMFYFIIMNSQVIPLWLEKNDFTPS